MAVAPKPPGRGRFITLESAPVWAEVAAKDGVVTTKEGAPHYRAGGHYLVFNEQEGGDAYAVAAAAFEAMYERADGAE